MFVVSGPTPPRPLSAATAERAKALAATGPGHRAQRIIRERAAATPSDVTDSALSGQAPADVTGAGRAPAAVTGAAPRRRDTPYPATLFPATPYSTTPFSGAGSSLRSSILAAYNVIVPAGEASVSTTAGGASGTTSAGRQSLQAGPCDATTPPRQDASTPTAAPSIPAPPVTGRVY